LLSEEPWIVDLGANHGEFSAEMVARHRARCIAVEPNPPLAESVRRRGCAEQVLELAIAGASGTANLSILARDDASTIRPDADASSTIGETSVRTTTLSELLASLGTPHIDLLKVDVEGLEVVALTGLGSAELARITQITVEFHDTQGYVTREQVRAAYDHLASAGFRRYRSSVRDCSDIFFVQATAVSRPRWILTCTIMMPIHAAARWVRRRRSSLG
jgi:FkbM family methyltransferase